MNELVGAFSFFVLLGLIIFNTQKFYQEALSLGFHRTAAFFNMGGVFSLQFATLFLVEPIFVLLWQEGSGYYVTNMPREHLEVLVNKAVFWGLIGYLSFLAGYRLRFNKSLGVKLPYFNINRATRLEKNFFILAYLMIGLLGLSIYGIPKLTYALFNPLERVELFQGSGYIFFLVQFYLTATLLWYLNQWNALKKSNLVGIVLWLLPVIMIIFGGRVDVAQIWLTMLVIYAFKAPKPRVLKIIFVFLSIFGGLGIYLLFRRFGQTSLYDLEDQLYKFGWSLRHLLVAFDNFIAYLDVFEQRLLDHTYGSPFWYIFYQIIPRQFSGMKPPTSGVVLSELIYPDAKGGTPFTIVGFLHWNFSVAAIIIGMFVFGSMLGILYHYYQFHREQNSILLIYSFTIGRLYVLVWGVFYAGLLGYAQFFLQILVAFVFMSHFKLYRKAKKSLPYQPFST